MLLSDVDFSRLIFWLDAHLSPSIAKWLNEKYGVQAASMRNLGLLKADDIIIFKAAKNADVILITKDEDFKNLVFQFGQPPKVILLNCGNTSNKALKTIITNNLHAIIETLVLNNEPIIEIAD